MYASAFEERILVNDQLLEIWRRHDAIRDGANGDLLQSAELPEMAPLYAGADALKKLSRPIRTGLAEKGIERLYVHQDQAITSALAGENVVLQAPTASGKTLAFQVPMLQELVRNPHGHALMICPTKALAYDQRDQLRSLAEGLPGRKIESWWYDGDTPTTERNALRRKPPPVLITNPDMLHSSFLGHAEQWTKFLSSLRWVIIDEMHEYRGYFGSNVAMILRRFIYHLSKLGASPQFFLCSATCANAAEHAHNLTGLDFAEINASNSMRPKRAFHFVQPDIPDFQHWEILQLRAVNAGLACVEAGKSVLVFCPTRNFAESCHRTARRQIEQREANGETAPKLDAVKVYRAGLATEERQSIQQGLKAGEIQLVFTTNALELGLDIGGLDGVILAGFPDSMMSAWQRIGRAGRNWKSDAFVLYVARNNPLDQFYAQNLHSFLDKPLDELVINPNNEELIERHLPCLLYESGFEEEGADILGEGLMAAAKAKAQAGSVAKVKGYRPHFAVDLRGGGTGMYTVEHGTEQMGTLSARQQFREAYNEAIYLHGGTAYRVEEVAQTGTGGTIRLGQADHRLVTRPSIGTFIDVRQLFDGRRWLSDGDPVDVFFGNTLVNEVIHNVVETDELTGEEVRRWKPEFNDARFENAHAWWITQEGLDESDMEGVTALQHLMRVGALFTIPIDTHDVYPLADSTSAYVVESYPGGIGIARKMLDTWRTILAAGINLADGCQCRTGCPSCIMPARSRAELDKRQGIALGRRLLAATEHAHTHELRNSIWEPVVSRRA